VTVTNSKQFHPIHWCQSLSNDSKPSSLTVRLFKWSYILVPVKYLSFNQLLLTLRSKANQLSVWIQAIQSAHAANCPRQL